MSIWQFGTKLDLNAQISCHEGVFQGNEPIISKVSTIGPKPPGWVPGDGVPEDPAHGNGRALARNVVVMALTLCR